MRGAITSAGILAESLATIGISCQRATFTTWSKSTGRCFLLVQLLSIQMPFLFYQRMLKFEN